MTRVLHLVKTSDGARWAAEQAKVLTRLGVEVHVALPQPRGEAVPFWEDAGAIVHIVDTGLPVRHPWKWSETQSRITGLIDMVQPDIIHSHFVSTTLAMRLALTGKRASIPRVFQVPGPLHLEHALYRNADIRSAGTGDYWIASSRYIASLYARSGVPNRRVYLSYYGMTFESFVAKRLSGFRQRLDIRDDVRVVGGISYMYPPKYYLGQTTGLKRHEDLIDALGIVCRDRPDVIGLIIGGEWGSGTSYRNRLRERAQRIAGDRIVFQDRIPAGTAAQIWPQFDCVVHVPISENCGGVVEPLASRVPTIASRVGGLPEVVFEGETGWLVPPRTPKLVAAAIHEALDNPNEGKRRAELGRRLVLDMFDVHRTGQEIAEVYSAILDNSAKRPPQYDSTLSVNTISSTLAADAHQQLRDRR